MNQEFPKITIVTPSYNQGKYIEDTILSVIGQGYPNLEYIIIDGGSTDETVSIIKKYESYLTFWVSEKDNGQSHAINKGFSRATGDILAWLNSDDIMMPNTLQFIARKIDIDEPVIVFGNCLHFKQGEKELEGHGSNVVKAYAENRLEDIDFIIQPSTFWTRKTWEQVGPLSEVLHFAFDWEWFLRAKKRQITFIPLAKCLSIYRIHAEHKSGIGGKKRQNEIITIYEEYSVRFAQLYKLLTEENVYELGFSKKVIRKLLNIVKMPNSAIDLLKLFNSSKYKQYSNAEIITAMKML